MRFLQKFNIYIYVLFLILFLLLIPRTFAYVNTDTSWNLSMQDYDTYLKSVSCGNNGSYYDVVQDFIDNISTEYYELLVYAPSGGDVDFLIKWKASIQYNNLYYFAYPNSGIYSVRLDFKFSPNTDRVPRYTLKASTCSNYQSRADYIKFKNLTDTGNYSTYGGDLDNFHYNTYSTDLHQSDWTTIGSSISNNSSYNTSGWFYYYSNDLVYKYQQPNNNSYYNKKLCIIDNDTCYVDGDVVPSYYDIYHNIPSEPTFIGYKTSLETFYTSLDVSDFSNYNLSVNFRVPQSLLGFYQTPEEYLNNTSFNYICSGRIDNVNYYSYDTFNCSLSYSYVLTDNTITYNFSNISTNQNLSSYDKIFITINPNYLDSNINTVIYDLNYTYNLGSIDITDYKGNIFETFSSLPLNFRLYLSSNNSIIDSTVYIKLYNLLNYGIKYRGFSNISNNQNLIIGNSLLGQDSDYVVTQVSNNIDTGLMIFQENSIIPLPSLNLYFNSGIIISINNNSSSNDFYYVDNTGSIVNNNFVISHIEDNNSFNISNYIGIVNNYINDLSSDILQFSLLTQNFYNSMPLIFQNLIFIIFILFCIYFTYELIKRR